MRNIAKFNELWESGQFTDPVCILIGGAAATGKSSLAQKLQEEISHMNLMGTPLIRTLLKLFIPKDDNPHLYKHTFDLSNAKIEKKDKKRIVELEEKYENQSEPIGYTIEEFVEFIASERQNYIIEGSNILPARRRYEIKNLILIEFFLKVTDEEEHRKMFSGPTHNRFLTKTRFQNLRLLQDYVVKSAQEKGKKVFEYDTKYSEILSFIDRKIGERLQLKE